MFKGEEYNTYKKRESKAEGGSLMTPPEREEYVFGSLAKLGTALTKAVFKTSPEKAIASGKAVDKKAAVEGYTEKTLNSKVKQAEKIENVLKDNFDFTNNQLKSVAYRKGDVVNYADTLQDLVTNLNAGKKAKTQELLNKLTFKNFTKERQKGGVVGSLEQEKNMYEEYLKLFKESRVKKAEGGSLMMPPEMMEEESIQEPVMDVPEDTYQSEDPIEVAASQESDEVIEQDQMEMVLGQALDSEEQQYLMNALEGDEQLSQIFDKVLTTASEFSGEGAVEGLGDGTSDSIPARLSDGEFVMTKKATDQIGSDNLQIMMDDAERAYDGGEMRDNRYGGGLLGNTDATNLSSDTDNTDDEIRKLMSLRANQAPSLR